MAEDQREDGLANLATTRRRQDNQCEKVANEQLFLNHAEHPAATTTTFDREKDTLQLGR